MFNSIKYYNSSVLQNVGHYAIKVQGIESVKCA